MPADSPLTIDHIKRHALVGSDILDAGNQRPTMEALGAFPVAFLAHDFGHNGIAYVGSSAAANRQDVVDRLAAFVLSPRRMPPVTPT
jgi:hypothetical protein